MHASNAWRQCVFPPNRLTPARRCAIILAMACIELENKTLVAIDFETTGLVQGWPNEPWQIGLCRFSTAQNAAHPDCYSSFLHVPRERPFNAFAPGRHSILRDELAAAPSLAGIWDEVSPRLAGCVLVAHNIGTERSMLRRAAPLSRLGPWIDTLAIARRMLPGRSSYALEDIVPDLGLAARVEGLAPPGAAPHDALYDAIACAEVLRFFIAAGLSSWNAV